MKLNLNITKYNKYLLKGSGLTCANIANRNLIADINKFEFKSFKIFELDENNQIQFQLNNFGDKIILGNGSYGVVYKGIYTKNAESIPAAIKKIIIKKHDIENSVCNELATIMNYNDIYAMKYYGFSKEVEQNITHIYIFTEYMNGEELNIFVKSKYPLDIFYSYRVKIISHLLQGLYTMHANNIYHRDIKPENIYITDDGLLQEIDETKMVVKYIDFGFSCNTETCSNSQDFVGTYKYMSPELILYKINKSVQIHNFYKEIDIWALGITLCEVLFSASPIDYPAYFTNPIDVKIENDIKTFLDTKFDEYKNALIIKYDVLYVENITAELKNIFEHLLKTNPAERKIILPQLL